MLGKEERGAQGRRGLGGLGDLGEPPIMPAPSPALLHGPGLLKSKQSLSLAGSGVQGWRRWGDLTVECHVWQCQMPLFLPADHPHPQSREGLLKAFSISLLCSWLSQLSTGTRWVQGRGSPYQWAGATLSYPITLPPPASPMRLVAFRQIQICARIGQVLSSSWGFHSLLCPGQ